MKTNLRQLYSNLLYIYIILKFVFMDFFRFDLRLVAGSYNHGMSISSSEVMLDINYHS